MRKVDIKATVEVMVPMRVEVEMTVRANEGVSLDRIVEAHFKGKTVRTGDVEEVEVQNVDSGFDLDEEDQYEPFPAVLNEHFNELAEGYLLRGKVVKTEVIDSR